MHCNYNSNALQITILLEIWMFESSACRKRVSYMQLYVSATLKHNKANLKDLLAATDLEIVHNLDSHRQFSAFVTLNLMGDLGK